MSEEDEAFLAAIYAEPDDDGSRLVYSDWLEERGQTERAEFIRLQCRLARGEILSEAEEEQVGDLVEKFREMWTAHLPQGEGVVWQFRRGFPEELEIEFADFLDNYDAWYALPRVRYLWLAGATSYYLRAFAAKTWNPKWVGFTFGEEPKPWLHEYGSDGSAGITALVRSPQAASLKELSLVGLVLGEASIRALCESPYLDGLLVLAVEKKSSTNQQLSARFGTRLLVLQPW